MNLLIVDDIPTSLKLLRALLEAEGHAVFEAHDGVDALDLLERQRVDAVISDILMPKMDGDRLCLEIRKRAPARPAHYHLHLHLHLAGRREAGPRHGRGQIPEETRLRRNPRRRVARSHRPAPCRAATQG